MGNSTIHSDDFNHIVGQGFSKHVKKAINNKQRLMARKNRAHNQYFHNNSAWIKLASSVRVDSTDGKSKLLNSGLPGYLVGNSLAINFYLFSEMKAGSASETYSGEDDSDLTTKFSSLRKNRGIYTRGAGKFNSSYGFAGLEFGLRPLPGITDLKVETLGNNGSLKKATINLTAFNKMQFNIIELLYLRLGYHVLIEYGNRMYITDSLGVRNTGTTLLERMWFGDENFVDINDPDLLRANEEVTQKQDEIVLIEQDKDEWTSRAEDEREQERIDEVYYNSENRDEDEIRIEQDAIDDGYTEEKYGSRGKALRAYADDLETGLSAWVGGYKNKKDAAKARDMASWYDATDCAVEKAESYEAMEQQRQEEINEKNKEIQQIREDINEKLNDYLDDLNKEIASIRRQYNFDYDGMIGRVTNFDWTLDTNGVYNIKIEVFSSGDVLQSLAVNNKNSPVGTYETTQQKDGSNPLNITKDAGDIVTALNNLATLARGYKVEDEEEYAKNQVSKKELAIVNGETPEYSEDVPEADGYEVETTEEELTLAAYLDAEKGNSDVHYMRGFAKIESEAAGVSPLVYLNRIDTIVEMLKGVEGAQVEGFDELGSQTTQTYGTGRGYEVVKVKANGVGSAANAFYIRFSYYLQFLQAITFPKFAGAGRLGKPMLRVLTEKNKYPFFKNDLVASSRPSICAIRTNMRVTGFLDAADDQLTLPQEIINDPILEILKAHDTYEMFRPVNYQVDGVIYGDIMDIYLNMDYLAKLLIDEETDEYGESNFLQHIGRICKDVNDSFGNVTQIDFKVDEDRNIVYFLDKKLLPGLDNLLENAGKPKNPYVFNINGFVNVSGAGLMGNIVRDFNLKSSIPPNLATMITVGSNIKTQGHTGRTDATAFSTWNKGLQDKIVPTKFIEGYDPQYRDGAPTLTTIKKRNSTYEKYFKNLSSLYTVKLEENISRRTEADTGWWWWQTEEIEVVDTYDTHFNGVDLTAESGMMELQRKAVSIPQVDAAIETGKPGPTAGFLPIDLQLTFNGTSGIKIFETYTVPTKFLPRSYPDGLTFICKKLTHSINDKGWLTKIQSFSLPATQNSDDAKTHYNRVTDLSPSYEPSSPSGGSTTGRTGPITVNEGEYNPPATAIGDTTSKGVLSKGENYDPSAIGAINYDYDSTAVDDAPPAGKIYFMEGGQGIGNYYIGDDYGDRGGRHKGQDIAISNGSFVAAQVPGVITQAAFQRRFEGAGGQLNFKPDGIDSFNGRIIHLNRIFVRNGDRVVAGQVIAMSGGATSPMQKGMGNTTGAHIHYEATVSGYGSAFNPNTDRGGWVNWNPSNFFRVGGKVTQVPDPR